MENEIKLYRYHEVLYSQNRVYLRIEEYLVIKKTNTGVWIDNYGSKKFVSMQSHKRFAWPTKKEALESFRARKRRQIKILRAQLYRAEAALRLNEDNQEEYFLE